MITYKEIDNLAAAEITISGRVFTEEFDATAKRLEAFINRHGKVRVVEIIHDFEDMDGHAFWHDLKFSLRHLGDFCRCAIVTNEKWFALISGVAQPFIDCDTAYFRTNEEEKARDWLLWPEGASDVL
jgi:hypothetical protein